MPCRSNFSSGIIIQYLVFNYLKIFPIWALIIITIVFGFLSHAILDPLAAKFTYHPPEANWHDIFWVSYHLGIYILTIFLFTSNSFSIFSNSFFDFFKYFTVGF